MLIAFRHDKRLVFFFWCADGLYFKFDHLYQTSPSLYYLECMNERQTFRLGVEHAHDGLVPRL